MYKVSKEIIGEKSNRLKGKKVILGVTSSAAIYKSIDLARELMRHGADVIVIMSPEARKLVSPELFKWATGNEVVIELTGNIEHISLIYDNPENTIVIIAPATANTISKIAHGIADNALLALALSALGKNIPIIVVPAMHLSMWKAPTTQKSIQLLWDLGIDIIDPIIEREKAKYPSIQEIRERVFKKMTKQILKGKRVLVTAGATRVYVDKIRFISNPSSGKMGVAMAIEAWLRGADVTLILSKNSTHNYYIPREINVLGFETFEEAKETILKEISNADIMIHAAAISDFAPTKRYDGKIPSNQIINLELRPTEKILELVARANDKCFILAFKAEWKVDEQELINRAKNYIYSGIAKAVIANDVSKKIFGSDRTEAYLIYKDAGIEKIIKLSGEKRIVASEALDILFA